MRPILSFPATESPLSYMPPCVAIEALDHPYTMSRAYRNSPYCRALQNCSLSGDMRRDVLEIAMSQMGYHEGDCDADMDGMNPFGGRNFTEYNRIYGMLDNDEGNGVSYGYAWCASFVSWCLRQAGVPTTIAPNEVTCESMSLWFRLFSVYHPSSSHYSPRPGDIVMFQPRGNGIANHVGFVVGLARGKLYTVEGNSQNKVRLRSYIPTDPYILGYCVPDYIEKE